MPAATDASRRASQRLSKRKRSSASADDDDATAALEAAVTASLVSSAAAAVVAAPTPSITTARRASSSTVVKTIVIDDDDDEIAMEALSFVAVYADVGADAAANGDRETEEFWIAQLLDDVTYDMLEVGNASVRVTWLDRVGSGGDSDDIAADADDNDEEGDDVKPKKKKKQVKTTSGSKTNRYEYAFDDALDVDTILCHVFALDCADGSMEITAKSLERVRRIIHRLSVSSICRLRYIHLCMRVGHRSSAV